ncbi:MAG: sulfatase-like hydrolase/transferase [Planctomycetes bacterium]|nr:sulfatase-like hydrolase/transferase [Planctomycetota bacterium]
MLRLPRFVLPIAIALGCAAAGSAADRPNVLVIMSDEHNADVLGCYGNKIVQTPNLDRLAARGVVFEAAYTNSPLCVPCRLSFTSGKYISRVSAWNNNCKLPPDSPSIARVMNAAGCESYLCGKMHYDRSCRYGFTEIGGNMNNSVMDGRGGRRAPGAIQPSGKTSGRFNQFHAGDTGGNLDHDRRVTAGVLDFLAHRKPADKPFFMIAGYLAPHFPLIVPQKYWDNYKDKVPMPVIPPGHLDSLPLNYRHLRVGFDVTDVDPATVKKGRELYYGLTQWLDEEIGKVLKTLDDAGLAENTVVIYTTDHGENLGEHGLWWKNCLFDSAARVPLIVSWPKRWPGGQRRAGACSLVDVVQTIAEIGGGEVPADWDGDSLCGYLDDVGHAWKDLAVSEYYGHNVASGYAMIRKGHYKYVYHTPPDMKHPAQRELYDLKADPGELRNLAADPDQKQRLTDLHALLVKELGGEPDATELRCREENKRGYGQVERVKRNKRELNTAAQ